MNVYEWALSKRVGGVTELTLLTPIAPGPIPGERRTYEERLRKELASVQGRVDRGLNAPISAIPTIHFASWLIMRPEQYLQCACFPAPAPPSLDPYVPVEQESRHDYQFRSWLFFTAYFDGDLKSCLRDFSNFLDKDIDRVWGNCEHYPAGGSLDFEVFWQYVKRFQIRTEVLLNAYPDLTVPRLHQLWVLYNRFTAFVHATRNVDGTSIDGVGDFLDKFIVENQAYTGDFPAIDGTYDEDQRARRAELSSSGLAFRAGHKRPSTDGLVANFARVDEAVARMEERIAGLQLNPILDNFEGVVCASLFDKAGHSVLWETEHGLSIGHIVPGECYRLVVEFKREHADAEMSRSVYRSLRINGGNNADSVTFQVALDSEWIDFEPRRAHVNLSATDACVQVDVAFWAPQSAGRHDVFIEVSQKNRLLQIVPLAIRAA